MYCLYIQYSIREAKVSLHPPSAHAAERREKVLALTQSFPQVWRGDSLGRGMPSTVPTGYPVLDAELPNGGWPAFGISELLWTHTGSGEFRLLLPALKRVAETGRTIVILGAPHRLIAPAFEQFGVDVSRILVVDADKPAERLWAAEQALKSSIGALLSWHPQVKAEHMRRLQVAASACDGLSFIFRHARSRAEPSPAPLRLLCQPAPYGQISVEVFKRRGPAATAPVTLPALLAPSLTRALSRTQRSTTYTHEPTHVVDSRIPAESSAGSRVPSLA